jgi:hypothetical protein
MSPPDEAPRSDADKRRGEGESTAEPSRDGSAEPSRPGADGQQPGPEQAAGPEQVQGGRREVEVPQSLYKVVTVFSTLLSVLFVVVGFSVMDSATTVVSNPPAALVVQVLSVVVPMDVLVANRSALALVVGLAGLGLVAGGAGVYVYGSRFRAPGMGKPKDEADEGSGDG